MSVERLRLAITLPEDVDDPTHYLMRVLNDMRSQGKWQRQYLNSAEGVPLRDPTTFQRVGTINLRDEDVPRS